MKLYENVILSFHITAIWQPLKYFIIKISFKFGKESCDRINEH